MEVLQRKFETEIAEMKSDIKLILAEFKNMNGKLIDTKKEVKEHCEDSIDFRDKVSKLWFLMTQLIPWALVFVFGSYAGVDIFRSLFDKIHV